MASNPIPIAPSHSQQPSMSSTSPSSSVSMSPQTPFFPPPGLDKAATSPPVGMPSSPPGANTGFFKWAAAAASLGRSPPSGAAAAAMSSRKGFDIPNNGAGAGAPGGAPAHRHDEHDHENHDSFEFGDFDDLKSRSWNKNRRTVSMSAGPGPSSGITAMLAGFGATSPPLNNALSGAGSPLKDPMLGGTNTSMPMSVPTGGVLAENAAKGQGVLRRLSMSGASFSRSGFLSPTASALPSPPPNTAAAPTPMPQAAAPFSDPFSAESKAPEAGLQRAATVSGATARGRRYSESGGKKRGVSPMGERILRDHGHF